MRKEVKFTIMLTPNDRYRHHHVRVNFAEHDIKSNWKSYKRQFLREDDDETQES